ncbi:helix-turn-helix domain-containing protein [Gracilibacillus alcaliphilus]|uniref:helix-turn-helix domain-containing protein n=1 Tax=Gracilibacillus alcaliphilus TaxID=1401441 RepID=UPI00195CA3FB|nr:helix-turn-helix domain-containing protein [Gracilibacillus alcaliphilus]MBM7679128.1 uncharacterized membrane protein YkvA (DUF1232 family)/antitoxin component HigA of HigAB toxin-antitoxin module [Gracilibacillus alcaliphilus]
MTAVYQQSIQTRLREQGMSMRQLAKETNINVSTISRILSGKRKPTLSHLRSISQVLDIPLLELIKEEKAERKERLSLEHVRAIIQDMQLPIKPFTLTDIEEKLAEYQQISQTDHGQKQITQQFSAKLSELNGQGPFVERLKILYSIFIDKKCPKKEFLLIGGALFYFITAMDLIPDYMLPVGYLDDALVIQYVMQSLSFKQ